MDCGRRRTVMQPGIVPADVSVDLPPPIHVRAEQWVEQPIRSREERDREHFEYLIKKMKKMKKLPEEEREEESLPQTRIVLYHDILDKLWGWDRLVPFGCTVSWSDYCCYLEAYNRKNKTSAIADIANICCKEQKLVQKFWNMEMILPMKKTIILSCLIHQCANSVIHTENCKSSDVSNAALWCMTKEADLTLELLTRGAPCNAGLVDRSSNIRICALSLMNCTLHSSAAASASALMLGIAKEAEMMCEWMCKNDKLLDFEDDDIELSSALTDGSIIRWRILDLMYDMLEESAAAAASSCDGVRNIDAAAKTNGANVSDILYPQCQKIEGGEGHFSVPLRGTLLPRSDFVDWSNYINYLEEYFKQNANGFLADQNIEEWLLDPPARAVQIGTATSSRLAAAVVNHCVKMEEELVSKWKARVPRRRSDTFSIGTLIESSLITECALAICSTKGEISVSSAIAFVCIAMEADLMFELLNRGADPRDSIIEQSRVIRMCALGLANLKGNKSNVSGAAMMGMAKEAKRMSDWMRRSGKKLFTVKGRFTFNMSKPGEIVDSFWTRAGTLDVMTRILYEASVP